MFAFGYDAAGFVACVTEGANFIRRRQGLPSLTLGLGEPGARLVTDDRIPVLKQARSKQVHAVEDLYQYMEEHSSLPPSTYVDDTGTTKNDKGRQAFNAALGGRQHVQIMAHFVSQSRVSASNNLHRVWDEHMAAKNPNPKRKVGQPTLAEAFKKARKKKKD